MTPLRITLAQINVIVGDLNANADKILEVYHQAQSGQQSDLVLFPELCLTGYPPEDLLLRRDFIENVQHQLARIKNNMAEAAMLVGFPAPGPGGLYNQVALLAGGKELARYQKHALPNYKVFDEKRYFAAGKKPCVIDFKGVALGLSICEDLWAGQPIDDAVQAGAGLIISVNASPFHRRKFLQRSELVRKTTGRTKKPLIYINAVGGQDDLVFDGGSMIDDGHGNVVCMLPQFEETLQTVTYDGSKGTFTGGLLAEPLDEIEAVYRALVLGTRDYVRKNGFGGVILGLSGGIDSALTACVAVDSLGAGAVEAVMMPTRYTSNMSLEDAEALASNLGVRYHNVEIEPIFKAFLDQLSKPLNLDRQWDRQWDRENPGVAAENLQARSRGMVLMAMSNAGNKLVLTTGNKSEYAVGYATLYGDMVGGYAPLKDVSKTLVYRLSEFCNRNGEVIPRRIIERPPSAELAPNQVDQDTLPDYDLLDRIIEAYVEQDLSPAEITGQGMDHQLVNNVIGMIHRSEYKRRQAAPGVRITPRAFGRDRRYPITNGYKPD